MVWCQLCALLSLPSSMAAVDHFVTKVTGFRSRGLGRGLGHERGVLESGMSAVVEEAPETECCICHIESFCALIILDFSTSSSV